MNCRNTIQMQKILDYLNSVKTHPNAETIFNAVKKDVPSITLATIYRNLNKLAELGKILKLEINGEFRFDADTCFHQHVICKNCGEVKDFFNEKISKNALKNFNLAEFNADSVSIKFYGVCKKCGGKQNE